MKVGKIKMEDPQLQQLKSEETPEWQNDYKITTHNDKRDILMSQEAFIAQEKVICAFGINHGVIFTLCACK